jgi:hypothetical protein
MTVTSVQKVAVYPVAGHDSMQYLVPGWTFDNRRPCLVR